MGASMARRPPARPGETAATATWHLGRYHDTTSQDAWDDLRLLPQHIDILRSRGIHPDVARERGYRSVTVIRDAKRVGFAESQCMLPALLIPLYNVAGEIAGYQLRPDTPRVRDGKPIKYESPARSAPQLDCPPRARRWVLDPEQSLVVTEGSLKADSAASRDIACLAIAGVWNWRSPDVIAALDQIPLKGRTVYLAFDSDWRRKPAVEQALRRFAAVLRQRGALVYAIDLPESVPGQKVGVDDYLAAGHGALNLFRLPAVELDESEGETQAGDSSAASLGDSHSGDVYRDGPGGIIRVVSRFDDDGREHKTVTHLTNFAARIVADIDRDDGSGEIQRVFAIEAVLGERRRRFTMPASRFTAMTWPTEHLGAGAIVYPGTSIREHARVAIQVLSGDVPERRVYTHSGWREIDGQRAYLHAGGGIGQVGQVTDIETELPAELRRLTLPVPPSGEERIAAIRSSLSVLGVAPLRITAPLLATVYRALLGPADFALHLAGPTGAGKSELAALAQQHYGAGFDSRHLPGSWLSTGNALEALAFAAKDALIVVDDFAPGGSAHDVARLHREADRLLRAQGNAAGRSRLRSDATLRPARPPRGLILSTGEDVPRGQSLRARLLVIEVSRDDVRWDRLTACQRDAATGLYAASLSAFIQWLVGLGDDLPQRLAREAAALRVDAQRPEHHRRTPAMVASLAAGWRIFIDFAQLAGAVSASDAEAIWQKTWEALKEAAAEQAAHQAGSEPAAYFLRLIRALMTTGRAHLAASDGGEPASAGAWGWRRDDDDLRPLGERIGWVVGEDVYLDPEASYAAAQRMARDTGESLPVGPHTLRRRLHELGYLISVEEARQTLIVRKVLEGKRRAVLHLNAAHIYAGEPDQPDHIETKSPESLGNSGAHGRVSWSGFAPLRPKPDQETRPEQLVTKQELVGAGQVGHVSLPGESLQRWSAKHALNGEHNAEPQHRVCAECGEPLPADWSALYCARHGGSAASGGAPLPTCQAPLACSKLGRCDGWCADDADHPVGRGIPAGFAPPEGVL